MALAAERPGDDISVCPDCGRAFDTARGLARHRPRHRRPVPVPPSLRPAPVAPSPPLPLPGWRIEAGAGGGWLWALSWRWRADGGPRLDAVPAQLHRDVLRRCWLAGISPADPDAVLEVAVALLAARGITTFDYAKLPAPTVAPAPVPAPAPAPPPVPARPRRRVRRRPALPVRAAPAPLTAGPPADLPRCGCAACRGEYAIWPLWRCSDPGQSGQSAGSLGVDPEGAGAFLGPCIESTL